MLFLKLAARNVLRQRRRSLFALCVVAFGALAMTLAWAVLDGQNAQMVRNMTETFSGHAQVQREGYIDRPSFDLSFDRAQVEPSLRHPAVAATAPRLSGTALVSVGARTRGVMVVGVDPAAERQVTRLHRHIVQGHALEDAGRGGLLVGRSLAKGMNLAVGDEVALLAEGMHASIGAQRLRVHGIFDTGNSVVDSLQLFVAMPDAVDLFGTMGGVTAVALRFTTNPDSQAQVDALQATLPTGYSAQGWRSLLPSVKQSVDFHEGVAHLLMLILFFIVTVGVAGVLQMSVAERLREFGTQLALGTTPWQLFRTIVYEGFMLAMAGLALGYGLAAAAVTVVAQKGIALQHHSDALQAMQGIGARIHPYLDPARLFVLAAAISAVALLATAVPALRAAFLSPLAALRGSWRDTPSGSGEWLSGQGGGRWPTLALALRNLFRAPWRTALGWAALSFGLAAFIFVSALAQGFLSQMVENTTGLVTGDVQIQRPQFRDDMQPASSFTTTPEWLAQVRAVPAVQAASVRMQGSATVSTPHKAESVTLVGMEPLQEQRVSTLHEVIQEGHGLRGDRDMLIGRKLAERLDVRVGEKVVTMVQDASGELGTEAFVVTGILDSGSHGPDSGMAFVTLRSAQRLYGTGEQVTSVTLRLHDRQQMPAALAQLQPVLPADGSLQAVNWELLVPEVAQTADLLKHGVILVLVIVFLMVAVIVMNTLLMSVLERSREFGTLMAIGADSRMISRLVGSEAGVLATAGVLGGVVCGGLLAWHFGSAGLSLRSHGADALGVSDVVHPILSLPLLVVASVVLWLLVLAVSQVPARVISRLNPVAVLRRV